MLSKNKWLPIEIIFIVILFYPIFFFQVFISDYLIGDGLVFHHYLYVSRRELLEIFLADWYQSLPFALIFAGGFLLLEVVSYYYFKKKVTLFAKAFTGCLIGGGLSVIFLKGYMPLTAFVCLDGIILASFWNILEHTKTKTFSQSSNIIQKP